MNRWLGLGLLLVLTLGALVFRLPALDRRPMHNDEGINALKMKDLWEAGRYKYDPDEFHGPSLYYATLPFIWLSGASDFEHLSETTLRLVTVAFGVGLILLLALLVDGLGWSATLAAGVFAAISPAMVFYSRYFIHEMLLVFFTALVFGAGWRWWQSRRLGWAMLAGAGVGLMYATKETFVISLVAMALAFLLTFFWNRWFPMQKEANAREPHSNAGTPAMNLLLTHTLASVAVAAAVAYVLFTSFFTNWDGPLDAVRTYLPWLHRAGGHSPHAHAWSFYLERLVWFHPVRGPVWTEGLIVVLAVVGAAAGLTGKWLGAAEVALVRFLSFYTLILTAAYSAISYKTPWCLLNFLFGLILLAGVGITVFLRCLSSRGLRVVFGIVLTVTAGQLGYEAYRASYLVAADRRNPYVYAQTRPEVLELVERLRGIAKVHPDGNRMVVKVISPESYLPLPWYLRQFKRVGWWDQMPEDPYAPVVIASTSVGASLDEKSNKKWLMAEMCELRPGVFLELYVEFDLWKKYVDSLPRDTAQ